MFLLHREMYCVTSDSANDLLEGTMMPKARASNALTILGDVRAPLATMAGSATLLTVWRKRLRSRHELSALSAEQMHDTGLDPELVRQESRKPFWKA
jgi:uncharacterized protein YjiS (DUF1127 family)